MQETVTAKHAAAIRAVSMIEAGMKLGIGTGSTAALAIEELGRRVRGEQLEVVGAVTSFAAERLARKHGVHVRPLESLGQLDFAFDGADEVSPELDLIKGRGAAHTREKVIAASADRFVVLVDESKLVTRLGEKAPVPVEVLPMATGFVSRRLQEIGGDPSLRMGKSKDGPVVTDQGFWIVDARFDSIERPAELSTEISKIPGVLDHGIFAGLATMVVVGLPDGTIREMHA